MKALAMPLKLSEVLELLLSSHLLDDYSPNKAMREQDTLILSSKFPQFSLTFSANQIQPNHTRLNQTKFNTQTKREGGSERERELAGWLVCLFLASYHVFARLMNTW